MWSGFTAIRERPRPTSAQEVGSETCVEDPSDSNPWAPYRYPSIPIPPMVAAMMPRISDG